MSACAKPAYGLFKDSRASGAGKGFINVLDLWHGAELAVTPARIVNAPSQSDRHGFPRSTVVELLVKHFAGFTVKANKKLDSAAGMQSDLDVEQPTVTHFFEMGSTVDIQISPYPELAATVAHCLTASIGRGSVQAPENGDQLTELTQEGAAPLRKLPGSRS